MTSIRPRGLSDAGWPQGESSRADGDGLFEGTERRLTMHLENNERVPEADRNMITIDVLDASMQNLTMLIASVGVNNRWAVAPDQRAARVQFIVLA